LANLLVRVAHLLYKLRIGGLECKCGELQVRTDDSDSVGVRSRVVLFEVVLNGVGVIFRQTCRGRTQAARRSVVLEERRTSPSDADILPSRQRSRTKRRHT